MLKTANLKILKMSELTQLGAVEGLRLSYESDNVLITSQASVCCCSVLCFALRAVLFQCRHSPFIHLSLERGM